MFFSTVKTGKNGILQFISILLLILLGIAIGQLPLGRVGIPDAKGGFGLDPNVFFCLLLLGFVGGFVFLRLAFPLIHKRAFMSLITEANGLDWKRLLFSFGLWFLMAASLDVIMYLRSPADYTWQFEVKQFIPLLFIAIVILPIQTSLEEIFFRGYLMQQIGLLSRSPWVPIIITSILFGCMHLANPEIQAFGTGKMMFYYISFGVLLGLCVVLDNRLEIALGMHAANNFYGATVVSFQDSALQTPSLFFQHNLDITIMLLLYVVLATVFFLILWKRFNWKVESLISKTYTS